MAQKSQEEIEDSIEERKNITRQLNKFLSDYFNWVVAGIVLIVFVIGFFAILLPKYEQTVKLIDAGNQQQTLDTSSKQNELDKINKLLATYNGIDKKYIDKVNAIAPSIQNKEELFSELNYLISVNQLSLQSVSLSPIENYQDQGLMAISPAQQAIPNEIQMVNVSIAVNGIDYESFKNLLTSLENNLRLIDVLSLNFAPGSSNTTLMIDTYYSKD
jgi:hypothetical protein